MNVDLWYNMSLVDKSGKVVRSGGRKQSRSYVQGFLATLFSHMSQDAAFLALSVDGTLVAPRYQWTFRMYTPTPGQATYGLVVGTGTLGVTVSDSALGSQIAHGTQAGQLVYSPSPIGSVNVNGSIAYFRVSRSWLNNTVATISIHEIGGCGYGSVVGGAHPFLHFRDLETLHVGVGQTATLVYEERVSL